MHFDSSALDPMVVFAPKIQLSSFALQDVEVSVLDTKGLELYIPIRNDTVIQNHTSWDLDVFANNTMLSNDRLFDVRALSDFGGMTDHRVGRNLSFGVDQGSTFWVFR